MAEERCMSCPNLFEQVYDLVRLVPSGRVVTYGQVARALGRPRIARQVGWAMRACPNDVPWHRVVNGQGRLSTRAEIGTLNPQRMLLEAEGVHFELDGRIDLTVYGWDGWRTR